MVIFFCKGRHENPWCRPDRTVRTDNVMRPGLSRSDHTREVRNRKRGSHIGELSEIIREEPGERHGAAGSHLAGLINDFVPVGTWGLSCIGLKEGIEC